MKKLVLFYLFTSVVFNTAAQTLYSDTNGVEVFYKIIKTDKSTSCSTNYKTSKNFSDKKINIWKIIIGIENGHSETIVPRGVGIANISINPNPLKPYSSNYCNYKKIKNYDSNGSSDQSLFIWRIRDFTVKEIAPGETVTNIAFLYLYEGQAPQLSNSEFLGYQLKKYFKSSVNLTADENDSVTIVKSSTQIDHSGNVNDESLDASSLTIGKKDTVTPIKPHISIASIKLDMRKEKSSIKLIEGIGIEKKNIDNDSIIKAAPQKVIEPVRTIKAIIQGQPRPKTTQKCPDEKELEYKNKLSSDPGEQRAYSWLRIYYSYKCECEVGSNRPDELVALINNVVDSYSANTNDAYGLISKVSKCKALENN